MKVIPFDSRPFVPAGHENPMSPGVIRKALVERAELEPGRIQMVNWATLGIGKCFAAHYHESMQEIFVMLNGNVKITVGEETATLSRGDAVVIDAREVHQMWNLGTEAVDYIAIGIVTEDGGKTVVVE